MNLRYCTADTPPWKFHPEEVMRWMGIRYEIAMPQPLGEQWWFWKCTGVPEELPSFLTVLTMDPQEAVNYGLRQDQADALEAKP